MNIKEAIAVLEGIKREAEQNVRYPGLRYKQSILEDSMKIEALDIGINELQITINNQ